MSFKVTKVALSKKVTLLIKEEWPDPEEMTEAERKEAEERRHEGLRLLARMIAREILRDARRDAGAAVDRGAPTDVVEGIGPGAEDEARAARSRKHKQAGG